MRTFLLFKIYKAWKLKRELKNRKIINDHLGQPEGSCWPCASSQWHLDKMRENPELYFLVYSANIGHWNCPIKKEKRTSEILDSIKTF